LIVARLRKNVNFGYRTGILSSAYFLVMSVPTTADGLSGLNEEEPLVGHLWTVSGWNGNIVLGRRTVIRMNWLTKPPPSDTILARQMVADFYNDCGWPEDARRALEGGKDLSSYFQFAQTARRP
jgi:hypothetical protein